MNEFWKKWLIFFSKYGCFFLEDLQKIIFFQKKIDITLEQGLILSKYASSLVINGRIHPTDSSSMAIEI